MGHIQAQDGQGFHVGEITQDFYEIFEIERTIERPYEYFDNVHLALNYEMNLNLFMHEREVYTTLDWFGNIGGLAQGLQLLFGALLSLLNYKYYNNYMVAKLFTYK